VNSEYQKRSFLGSFETVSELAKIARFPVSKLVLKSKSQKLNQNRVSRLLKQTDCTAIYNEPSPILPVSAVSGRFAAHPLFTEQPAVFNASKTDI
jgi:hypothetical protein